MQIESGRAAGGIWIIAVIFVAVLACPVGLILMGGIESSRADRAGAVALAEQAKAGARAAEAQARVDEVEVKADRDVALLVERNAQQVQMLQENNRIFQEKLLMLATIVEGMEAKKVDRLESLLGWDNETSPLAIAIAVIFAAGIFLMFVWFWKYFRPALHAMGENLWRT